MQLNSFNIPYRASLYTDSNYINKVLEFSLSLNIQRLTPQDKTFLLLDLLAYIYLSRFLFFFNF